MLALLKEASPPPLFLLSPVVPKLIWYKSKIYSARLVRNSFECNVLGFGLLKRFKRSHIPLTWDNNTYLPWGSLSDTTLQKSCAIPTTIHVIIHNSPSSLSRTVSASQASVKKCPDRDSGDQFNAHQTHFKST